MSGYKETSGEAYDSVLEQGLGRKQQCVLDMLINNPSGLTNQELSTKLGWPINTVTPRTGDLVKKGLVEENGWRVGSTGRRGIVWVESK